MQQHQSAQCLAHICAAGRRRESEGATTLFGGHSCRTFAASRSLGPLLLYCGEPLHDAPHHGNIAHHRLKLVLQLRGRFERDRHLGGRSGKRRL